MRETQNKGERGREEYQQHSVGELQSIGPPEGKRDSHLASASGRLKEVPEERCVSGILGISEGGVSTATGELRVSPPREGTTCDGVAP